MIAPTQSPTETQSQHQQSSGKPTSSDSATPKNRPVPGFAAATDKPSKSPSGSPSGSTDPSESPSGQPEAPSREDQINDPLAWQTSPDSQSVAAFNKFSCPADGTAPLVKDNPAVPLITCDDKGQKFLLSKAIIEGTQLKSASAGIPQQEVAWAVNLQRRRRRRQDDARGQPGAGQHREDLRDHPRRPGHLLRRLRRR